MRDTHPPVTYRTLQDVIDHFVLPILDDYEQDFDAAGIAARVTTYCPKCGGFHIRPMFDADNVWYERGALNTVLAEHDLTAKEQ